MNEKENSWVSSSIVFPVHCPDFFLSFYIPITFIYIPTTFLQLDIWQAFGPQFISGVGIRKTLFNPTS